MVYNRPQKYKRHERQFTIICEVCGRRKNVAREDAKTCSNACRMRLSRLTKVEQARTRPAPASQIGAAPAPTSRPAPAAPAAAASRPAVRHWIPNPRQVEFSRQVRINGEIITVYPVFTDGQFTPTQDGKGFLFRTISDDRLIALPREQVMEAVRAKLANKSPNGAA